MTVKVFGEASASFTTTTSTVFSSSFSWDDFAGVESREQFERVEFGDDFAGVESGDDFSGVESADVSVSERALAGVASVSNTGDEITSEASVSLSEACV